MRRKNSWVWRGVLLLVAAGTAAAQEGSSAIESAKKEIQQLQSDQKVGARASSDKQLSGDGSTPQFLVPLGDAPTPESWLAEKKSAERKKELERRDTNKNWLVDGVEKLSREESQQKSGAAADNKVAAASDRVPTGKIDSSDPQYLLKLFDQQKKSGETKTAAANKTPAVAAPDPFAPFLENWLGSSPVRGQFFDQFARKADASAAVAPVVVERRMAAGEPSLTTALPDKIAPEKGNPYLAELNAPLPARELPLNVTPIPSLAAPPPSWDQPKVIGPLPPLEPARDNRPVVKGPPPSLADEKKYFPQLKRF